MVDCEDTLGVIEGWRRFLHHGTRIWPEQVDEVAASVLPADPGLLYFSAGSTGAPKGILSAHRGVCLQLWRWRKSFAFDEGVRSWSANGFFWPGNFAIVLGGTLSAGGSLILQRTFQAEEALKLMEAEAVSYLFALPHQWSQLTEAKNWLDVDLSSLRYIDVNSPIARHPSVKTRYLEPSHTYGTTETFTLSTAFPANTPKEISDNSHGQPLAGNSVKIVNPLTGKTTPLGESGEIAVKGPTLMLGYLGVPLDESLDSEGFFHTGDGGFIDKKGRLHWTGRLAEGAQQSKA
jgi:fatty-acyl-CoA synthase